MQKASRRQIMPRVYLTCVKTEKFKTGLFSVSLVTDLEKGSASLNAVLPRLLRRGTARLPDMEAIAAELDGLYGARIEPIVQKKGEKQLLSFISDFADDAFVAEKDILERVIALTGEMLLTPATSGGRLRQDYVEGERDQLIDEIRSLVNDKRRYAELRLIEQMCAGEAYAIPRLGTEADAEKITVFTATKHYREILSSADVEIFYCGSAEYERVERAALKAFAALPRILPQGGSKAPAVMITEPKHGKMREFTESLDVTQGKLTIGYRMGEIMLAPNYAALSVMNAVFGGSVTSKLFLNVREKLSLCYYAGSYVDKLKGIMLVSSGIDLNKYDEALSEIERQLCAVKSGDFTDWELESAKRAIITALKTTQDSALRLEQFYIGQALLGLDYTPDDMAALTSLVEREDVCKAAAGIKADAAYFLKGGEACEN